MSREDQDGPLAAKDGAHLASGFGDRCVANGVHFVSGQGVIVRTQGQPIRQRATAFCNAGTYLDVEQPQRLEQRAGASPQCGLDVDRRDVCRYDQRNV
jgi:hypothetical protein